jgi:hypothetical protein
MTDEDKNVTFYIETHHNSGTSSLYESRENATDAKINRIIKKSNCSGKKIKYFCRTTKY